MPRFHLSLLLLALPAVAACTAEETTAAIEDPGAFICREEAVNRRNVAFEDTSADLINVDISDNRHYTITAHGRQNRCSVDADGNIFEFHTI